MQETPNGDFVIVTFEGENPAKSFGKMMAAVQDEFAEFVLDVRGFDMKGPPRPLPQLVYDSRAEPSGTPTGLPHPTVQLKKSVKTK